jgi:hypothetical protein
VRVVPVPTSTKFARSSFSARAKRVNLLYFSFARGTRSRTRARSIPEMDTKRANAVNPAVGHASEPANGEQTNNTHRALCDIAPESWPRRQNST